MGRVQRALELPCRTGIDGSAQLLQCLLRDGHPGQVELGDAGLEFGAGRQLRTAAVVVERVAARLQHARRGLTQPAALFGPAVRRVRAGVGDRGGQPLQLVDQPDAQARPGAQAAAARAADARNALRSSRPDRLIATRGSRLTRRRLLQMQHDPERAAQRGRLEPQHIAVLRRPDEHRHRNADSQRDAPTGQPFRQITADPGSITARMNASSAAWVPALTVELTTPEKSTANATTGHRDDRQPVGGGDEGADRDQRDADHAEHRYAPKRAARPPGKLTNSSRANEPNAAKVATWALPITCEPIAKLTGTTTAARNARLPVAHPGSRARSQRQGFTSVDLAAPVRGHPVARARHGLLGRVVLRVGQQRPVVVVLLA